MARECFVRKDFRPESRALIQQAVAIVKDYLSQGLRLTLRQLYYQLVTQNVIPNEERSYRNLGSLISDARLAGLLDWDAIEDRVRVPRRASEFTGIPDLMAAALRSYRLPRWEGQLAYAELWVEKDALAGVLEPLAREHHVTLMVNRGYSSQSAMYESAARFRDADKDGDLHLFYLGDHDPSGEDMVRDVRDRLALFGAEVNVEKVALTTAQVKQYRPPPNPAKVTDSRAKAYIAKHGHHSWEVDALPPKVLAKLVRAALAGVIDQPTMDAVKLREEDDKARLEALVQDHWPTE